MDKMTQLQTQPIDKGVMWYVPALDDLRFMRALYVNHHFKPHAHDHYVIGIVEAGVQSFQHKREKLVTVPGKIIMINPDEVHTGEAEIETGFTYRALYPTVPMMQSVGEQLGIKHRRIPYFGSGVVYDRDLFARLQQFHHRSEQGGDTMQLETLWLMILADLIQRHTKPAPNSPHTHQTRREIHVACDYIHAHFAENLSLSDVAAQAHMSSFHFARMFRQQMGITPHKYLENVRIKEAERLLLRGQPIADVAYATGFSSQSHLTRTFKRFMGVSPGQFMQQRKIV